MKTFKLAVIFFLFASQGLFASGASEGITKGNAAFGQGKYADALAFYEEAGVKEPESPYVYFNKGAAYLATEEYDKAKEAFKNAVSKTKDTKLEAKANYNLGETSFREAGKNAESDLKKAVELYKESIAYFEACLERDKTLTDAAQNIEVARLILKDMLDKLAKQEEQNKDKTDKLKEIVEKIAKLVEREETIINYNTTLSEEKDKKGMSQTLSNSIGKLKGEQTQVRVDTIKVNKELEEVGKSMQQAAEQIAKAGEHLGNATNLGQLAENQLAAKDLGSALGSEGDARDEFVKALEALAQPQDQDNQNQQNEQKEQEEKEAQAAQAKDIIDQEKEDKKARQQAVQGGYSAPDKDW